MQKTYKRMNHNRFTPLDMKLSNGVTGKIQEYFSQYFNDN